jgi:hypothetical protein
MVASMIAYDGVARIQTRRGLLLLADTAFEIPHQGAWFVARVSASNAPPKRRKSATAC